MEIVHHSNSPGAEGFRPLLLCGTAGKTLAQLRARKTQSCGKVPAIWDCSGRLPEALSQLGEWVARQPRSWFSHWASQTCSHPFTWSLIKKNLHSFIYSFFHSLFHSLSHSFSHSSLHSFTHSPTQALAHLVIRLFTHCLTCSLIHPSTHSFVYSFIQSVDHSLIH